MSHSLTDFFFLIRGISYLGAIYHLFSLKAWEAHSADWAFAIFIV